MSRGLLGCQCSSVRDRLDISCQRFGKLVALRPCGKNRYGVLWYCVCDCGGRTTATPGQLNAGQRRTCGCMRWSDRKKILHTYAVRPFPILEHGTLDDLSIAREQADRRTQYVP